METTERERRLLLGGDFERAAAGEPLMGWSSVGQNCPKWAQDRVIEIRQALLAGRTPPPPSREYIESAERRSALGRTVINKLFTNQGHRSDIDEANRRKLAEVADQIRRDAIDTMSSAELRKELDKRMGGMDKLPCPAQSLTATRRDHLDAQAMHNAFANKAAQVGRKDEAIAHFTAAQEHCNAASVLDDDGDTDDRSQTLTRCLQSCRDSFAFGAGSTLTPDANGWIH
jgi:hypothetical protein